MYKLRIQRISIGIFEQSLNSCLSFLWVSLLLNALTVNKIAALSIIITASYGISAVFKAKYLTPLFLVDWQEDLMKFERIFRYIVNELRYLILITFLASSALSSFFVKNLFDGLLFGILCVSLVLSDLLRNVMILCKDYLKVVLLDLCSILIIMISGKFKLFVINQINIVVVVLIYFFIPVFIYLYSFSKHSYYDELSKFNGSIEKSASIFLKDSLFSQTIAIGSSILIGFASNEVLSGSRIAYQYFVAIPMALWLGMMPIINRRHMIGGFSNSEIGRLFLFCIFTFSILPLFHMIFPGNFENLLGSNFSLAKDFILGGTFIGIATVFLQINQITLQRSLSSRSFFIFRGFSNLTVTLIPYVVIFIFGTHFFSISAFVIFLLLTFSLLIINSKKNTSVFYHDPSTLHSD